MSEPKTDGGAAVPCISLLDRSELIGILEQHLAVTDEWGGCKLASWQWGNNVVVDGIDAAADAILARLSNTPISGGTPSAVSDGSHNAAQAGEVKP